MSEPLVSVVMGTYNHAPFVAEAIRSVLAQDFTDYEFLIADDGSSDGTAAAVAEFSDPRIRFQAHPANRGAALVLNELVGQARGRYICVLNSDDSWMSGKLSEQIALLERRPEIGAAFGRVEFIDGDGAPIDKDSLSFGHVFDQPNRTRGEWLRYFFWHGNCLCHPSVMIRREIYEAVGLYDNRMRQLPDFDMWIRVVKVSDIFVSPNAMVRFRILPGENTSSDTPTNHIRTLNEHFFIGLGFFENMSADLLRQGFGDRLSRPDLPLDSTRDIEAALLFFRPVVSLERVYRLLGILKLRELLGNENSRTLLAAHYDFDDRALQRLAAEVDTLYKAAPQPAAPLPQAGDVSRVPTKELVRIIGTRLRTRARHLARPGPIYPLTEQGK
ncbi:MAG TPA: glycosyltransferase [Acidocella sp.]|jgi:glycosyltransferase involved in cell wall biosynthesis|uniref:glycosyltransferase n=1 Tax=Acidocella sp. TaxID=50710 RepID=UPI002CAA8A08|nr:glycosyltransferase [Acidocella sp.]HVE23090.1 glycosyltransferase [Acidocella sp.]